uniref:Zgc:109744 n=1 Tax=Neogobius melanostomus TaxID=47308 RepID=A0A8C6S950_9GOBI
MNSTYGSFSFILAIYIYWNNLFSFFLGDDYYWKLVADFIGPQSGEGLDLDRGTCKNRVLIQVGLLKEDNNFPWRSIIDWLKQVFPAHKTADFRRLIQRGITTTLSLFGDSRLTFLELAVNFDFVGPICDSIGIERQDLLQLSDFSERAQLIEVTNGLVLELEEFIQRENLAPVVIVHWLRNFAPEFCKNEEYSKVFSGLKAKIKTLKMYCSSSETKSRRNRRYVAIESLLLSPFDLTSLEEPLEESKIVVKKRKKEDQPIFKRVTIKKEPECYEITEEETVVREKTIKQNTIKEESSQDHDKPNSLELIGGYDESLTLLDIAVASVYKLSSFYDGITEECKEVSLELLKNQYALMCKEKSEVVEFEKTLTENSFRISLGTPVEFIHHNANFIAEVHKVVEEQIMSLEKEIIQTSGSTLGRDKLPKFKGFSNFGESATSRYIHMACALLSPKSVHNRTFRKHWMAFCKEKKNPSELMEQSTDRICNYFEASAGLIHHYKEVGLFFSDMLALESDTCPNIVLESVTNDANDSIIQSFVCVLALIYCKILGPYLKLLKSAATFTMYPTYLLWLYQRFLNWSKEPSTMLEPEIRKNVFAMNPFSERTYNGVFSFCGYWSTNRELIRVSLKRAMKAIATAADNHLRDYLPGGKYSQIPSPELSHKLSRCTFSVLMVENPFQTFYNIKKQVDSDASSASSEEEDDEAKDEYEQGESSPARLHGDLD